MVGVVVVILENISLYEIDFVIRGWWSTDDVYIVDDLFYLALQLGDVFSF